LCSHHAVADQLRFGCFSRRPLDEISISAISDPRRCAENLADLLGILGRALVSALEVFPGGDIELQEAVSAVLVFTSPYVDVLAGCDGRVLLAMANPEKSRQMSN